MAHRHECRAVTGLSGAALERPRDLFQFGRHPMQIVHRHFFEQTLAGMRPVFADVRGHAREGGFRVAADLLQIVKNAQQNVVFPDFAQAIGDLAQPTVELAGDVGIELQDRQDFAEAAGGHPRPVQAHRRPRLRHPVTSV